MRSVILASKLTLRNKRAIAQQMSVYAPQVLRGDLQQTCTWRCGLRRIGCAVVAVHTPDRFVAGFTPDDPSRQYPVGEVVYNLAQPKGIQVRGLAHEFGHALCQKWIPEMVFDAEIVYSYHDDSRNVRHQIARLFEEIMLG